MTTDAETITALQDRVRELTLLLDKQMGTPCEQIRHEQEAASMRLRLRLVERKARKAKDDLAQLKRIMEMCADAVADVERARDVNAARALSAEAERDRMREALEPFAREADEWAEHYNDDGIPLCCVDETNPERAEFTIGDLRRARQALNPKETDDVE